MNRPCTKAIRKHLKQHLWAFGTQLPALYPDLDDAQLREAEHAINVSKAFLKAGGDLRIGGPVGMSPPIEITVLFVF